MLLIISFLLVSAVAFAISYRNSHRLSLPGPKGRPIIGNALQVPKSHPWLQFTEWGKIYGDVVFLKIFGRSLVILNSREAAIDLFEKRSAIYSERPKRNMAQLCGFGKALLFSPYGDVVRKTRKLLHADLNPRGCEKHQALQEQEARHFVKRIMFSKQGYLRETKRLAASLVLKIAYHYEVTTENDPLVALAEKVMGHLIKVITPNEYLVDALPFLRHVPRWFPGAAFQKEADNCRHFLYRLMDEPFDMVRKRMELGTAKPCLVTANLEGREDKADAEEIDVLKWTAGGLFAGGSDTTVALITTFLYLMLQHPEVMKKGQAEIDRVIGSQRLPSLSDREDLPYLDCILKEVLRYHPVAPLAAHSSLVDDVYRGYVIPARSVVMVNSWALTHDEVLYPNPTKFNPDRYLEPMSEEAKNFMDPRTITFGFGRSCPGLYLADRLFWITLATTLATLDITANLDSSGKPITDFGAYGTGAVSHPPPFKCRMTPRSPEAAALISFATEDAEL